LRNVGVFVKENFLTRSHSPQLSAYEDGTERSETSAYKIQTPGNYPEGSIQQFDFSLKRGYIGGLQFGCYYLQYVPASKPSQHA